MAKERFFSRGELKSLGFSNLERKIKVQGSLRNLWGWDCPGGELGISTHYENSVCSESWETLTKDSLDGKS